MSSLVAKRIILSSFLSSSPHHHHLAPLTPFLLRFLSTQHQKSTEVTPLISQYLISSLGISRDRAIKLSTRKNPESVVTFLKETGLSDTQIKGAVSLCPHLLGWNVEKRGKPKVRELTDAGFSGELLVLLIRNNPSILMLKDTLPRLLFWRDFIGKGEQGLLKFIPKHPLLFKLDIDKHIAPRINLLKEYGLLNRDIVLFLLDGGRSMTLSMNSLREKLELVEELGVPRGSTLYWKSLKVVTSLSKETVKRKMEFFKTICGWSEEEISFAFRTYPSIFSLSEERVKLTMDFLVKTVGMEPKSIAFRPVLFGYNFKKRLVPRQQVLSILAAKSLRKRCNLLTACAYTEKRFLEVFVEPYKKDVPDLAEAYVAASGGNISV